MLTHYVHDGAHMVTDFLIAVSADQISQSYVPTEVWIASNALLFCPSALFSCCRWRSVSGSTTQLKADSVQEFWCLAVDQILTDPIGCGAPSWLRGMWLKREPTQPRISTWRISTSWVIYASWKYLTSLTRKLLSCFAQFGNLDCSWVF